MANLGSSPTLIKADFKLNQAYNGGGMYNIEGSAPMVSEVTFTGNTAICVERPGLNP